MSEATASGSSAAETVPRWVLSAAPPAAAIVSVLLAGLGLLSSQVALVLFALPIAVSAAWAWDRRPRVGAPARVTATVTAPQASAQQASPQQASAYLHYSIAFDLPPDVESVQLRLGTLGARTSDLVLSRARARHLEGRVPVLHSGPQQILHIEYRLLATEAAFVSAPAEPFLVRRVVTPPFAAIASLPLPSRLLGLTGTHDSSRPGDGGEFHDIHPFTPGDRLRRIDWKATARRAQLPGELYVRRSHATADATVLLVVDSRDDVGENVADWSRSTSAGKGLGSMDVAREAASSVAAGYIKAGDRVGFQDLATQSRLIAAGAGTRHLHRVLRAIELTQPSGAPSYRQRPPLVTPGSLIYVFSTFLDDEAGRMAELWRGGGHRVIGIDVLPTPRLDGLRHEEAIALRIVMMDRHDRIRALKAIGVEVLSWHEDSASASGSSSREAQFRALSRVRSRR